MTIKLIKIGNSRGIRLPKSIIEKYQLDEDLIIEESDEGILIKPKSRVRHGWDEQFASAKNKEYSKDHFEDFSSVANDFDDTEWTW